MESRKFMLKTRKPVFGKRKRAGQAIAGRKAKPKAKLTQEKAGLIGARAKKVGIKALAAKSGIKSSKPTAAQSVSSGSTHMKNQAAKKKMGSFDKYRKSLASAKPAGASIGRPAAKKKLATKLRVGKAFAKSAPKKLSIKSKAKAIGKRFKSMGSMLRGKR